MLETEKKTVATNFTGVRKLCIPKAEQRFVLGNSAKYRAELIYKGSTFRIGYFPTLETAVTAYNTEASKLGGLVRHYYDSSLSNPFSTLPAFIRPKRILMGWWFGVPSLHSRVWAWQRHQYQGPLFRVGSQQHANLHSIHADNWVAMHANMLCYTLP